MVGQGNKLCEIKIICMYSSSSSSSSYPFKKNHHILYLIRIKILKHNGCGAVYCTGYTLKLVTVHNYDNSTELRNLRLRETVRKDRKCSAGLNFYLYDYFQVARLERKTRSRRKMMKTCYMTTKCQLMVSNNKTAMSLRWFRSFCFSCVLISSVPRLNYLFILVVKRHFQMQILSIWLWTSRKDDE